ncbi:hypothetical protein SAMN05444164_5206 [Bradyrhizobium erythrophlei]|uniref:Uncharacterized protein n=1 Tax=Bradyrhizobium erythrophlei TaxID=1437360 RepID=A0A1H5BZN9_9BRAD|nr:hypothetical protein SAMN05444164_5206 [Bradyrhizobium erythrophlei]
MLPLPAQAGKKNKANARALVRWLNFSQPVQRTREEDYFAARFFSMVSQIIAATSGPLSR